MQAQMAHILFVDDEPRMLDGLRQSLRGTGGLPCSVGCVKVIHTEHWLHNGRCASLPCRIAYGKARSKAQRPLRATGKQFRRVPQFEGRDGQLRSG